jgi:hypothetical protein
MADPLRMYGVSCCAFREKDKQQTIDSVDTKRIPVLIRRIINLGQNRLLHRKF